MPQGSILSCFPDAAKGPIKSRCCVVLPPRYAESQEALPVLFLLHGIQESETDWHTNRNIVALLDALREGGYIPAMVVVMPFGFLDEEARSKRQRPEPGAFDAALTKTVVEVEGAYDRISRSPRQRAIAGISMGGRQALEFGLAHPQQFSIIGTVSAAIGIPGFVGSLPVLGDPKALQQQLRFFFSRCGTQDKYKLAEPNANFIELVRQAGVSCDASVADGEHNWDFWLAQLPVMLTSIGATLAPAIALRSLLHAILMTIHFGRRENQPPNDAADHRIQLMKPEGWPDQKYRELAGWCQNRLPEDAGKPDWAPADDSWKEIRKWWAEKGLARGDENPNELIAGFLDGCEALLQSSIESNAGATVDVSLVIPESHWRVAQALTNSKLTATPWKNNVQADGVDKWKNSVPMVSLHGTAEQLLETLHATRAALTQAYTSHATGVAAA